MKYTPEPQTDPIAITPPSWTLRLDDTKDYIVDFSVRTTPLAIVGGRHVRIIGGEIQVSGGRALLLKNQVGSAYVEGVKFGLNINGDSIGLDQSRGARVTIQNCDLGEVRGSYAGWHADLIQTWNGPRRLEIDGVIGKSNYQGLFLEPLQYGTMPERFEISNVFLDLSDGNYALWRDSVPVWCGPNVVVQSPKPRDSFLWPKGDPTWDSVTQIMPFITSNVGAGY